MSKRIVTVFSIFCVLMCLLNIRVADLTSSPELKETAQNQRSYPLTAGKARGKIYDRKFTPLVGNTTKTFTAVLPQAETAAALLEEVDDSRRQELYQLLQGGTPFLTDLLPGEDYDLDGITSVEVPQRYSTGQLAAHVIGYVNSDGSGVTGIEKAYNDLLSSVGEQVEVHYSLDGLGRLLGEGSSAVTTTGDGNPGVVLTLDRELQSICETVGAQYINKGAIVIMDPSTGKLLACASFPSYDPDNVAESLTDERGPLLNRCFAAFPVGSTFKVTLAAAALDMGIDAGASYDCTGWIDVSGQPFKCHLLSGHGVIDMKKAMVESCNTYFINLGGQLGAEKIVDYAQNLGFGRQTELAPGLTSAAGLLPKASELPNPADVANLSLGQGRLLATPVQLCQMVAAVVNGGKTPIPQLVEGTTSDGVTLNSEIPSAAPIYAMSETTAETLRDFLESAVEQKDNMKAKPTLVTAAGKTATAQTGSFDENGEEILDVWFAGYFPAESPKYVVSVMVEHGRTGNLSAGPVFANIADQITLLDEIRTEQAKH